MAPLARGSDLHVIFLENNDECVTFWENADEHAIRRQVLI